MVEKSPKAYRSISETAELVQLKPHVLRFWESKFNALNPMTRGGGRRFYSPEDIQIIEAIKELHYERGLTIRAANKLLEQYGADAVAYAHTVPVSTNMEIIKPAEQNASETINSLSELTALDARLAKFEENAIRDIAHLNSILKNLSAQHI